MKKWLLAGGLILAAFPFSAMAQTKESLVGTWKLVSAKDVTDKREVKDAFGPNPIGFLTYTADGRVTVIITDGGRKPLSIPDRISAPVEERAEAFATLVAYAGSYTLTGDKVIHHIEVAWMQNIVNRDMVRSIQLKGDRLTLQTPPFSRGGLRITYQELVCERVKPNSSDK